MIRVLVAEDSHTVQELLVAILESDPEVRVVGQARTGAEAVALAERLKPDLITMDIHMPVMDGLQATTQIMARVPTPIVVVSSSTARTDTARSFEAIRAGALGLVEKPENPTAPDGKGTQFLAMVKAMADLKVVRRRSTRTSDPPPKVVGKSPRRERAVADVVAIAASTGGPVALQQVLSALPRDFPVPIVVVQHIASGFVWALSEWLGSGCDLRVKVAEDGETLMAGTVYLAPDACHLGILGRRVSLSNTAAIKGHRPSATHLFESAAQAFGNALVAVVLTGMGRDGVDGLAPVRAAGGYVIAQDRATSVVYGMPGEAVAAKRVDAVTPLNKVGDTLMDIVMGEIHADARSGR